LAGAHVPVFPVALSERLTWGKLLPHRLEITAVI
jgi:hypothetical protein